MEYMNSTPMMLLSSCCALYTCRTPIYILKALAWYICEIERRIFSRENKLIIDNVKSVAWKSS